MTAVLARPTRDDYDRAFALEAALVYPEIDAYERACGCALPKTLLDAAARVLACPVKVHPPHWAHGRVIYATALRFLRDVAPASPLLLDIGTAKGFSALCLSWALTHAGLSGRVVSVDVVYPEARVGRNTVAELDHLLTVRETLHAAGSTIAADASEIEFKQSTGVEWLTASSDRVHVSFVDGKHAEPVVTREAAVLASRQETGDIAIFDDVQIPGVCAAVARAARDYTLTYLRPRPHRAYVVGVRR